VQQHTEHLASLGAVRVHRDDYLAVLARLRDVPVVLATDRRAVERLAAPAPS
jgi:Leu/Phe-tRNA-protein transferase